MSLRNKMRSGLLGSACVIWTHRKQNWRRWGSLRSLGVRPTPERGLFASCAGQPAAFVPQFLSGALSLLWWLSPLATPGFPADSVVKNLLQSRRPRFDPWVGKIPWRREWQPPPVFVPGKSHGQRTGGLHSVGSQRVRYT